jgi:signal peptidase II
LQAGRVTDLISLGSFPVFNLADASISIGVAILLGSMLLQKRRPTEPEDALAEIEQTPG